MPETTDLEFSYGVACCDCDKFFNFGECIPISFKEDGDTVFTQVCKDCAIKRGLLQ